MVSVKSLLFLFRNYGFLIYFCYNKCGGEHMKILEFFKSLGIILLYVLVVSFTSSYAYLISDSDLLTKNIALIIGDVITVLVIALCMTKKLKGQFNDFKKNYKTYTKKAIKYWLIGFAVMFLSNMLIIYLFSTPLATNEEANREMLGLYPLYSVISMCVLAPIVEEMLFRLNFKNVIKKRVSFVLITGILFGLIHILSAETIEQLIYIIPYSALGIAFAAAFYDTDNIYTSITAHIIHNT